MRRQCHPHARSHACPPASTSNVQQEHLILMNHVRDCVVFIFYWLLSVDVVCAILCMGIYWRKRRKTYFDLEASDTSSVNSYNMKTLLSYQSHSTLLLPPSTFALKIIKYLRLSWTDIVCAAQASYTSHEMINFLFFSLPDSNILLRSELLPRSFSQLDRQGCN